jgi:hypothetical protein
LLLLAAETLPAAVRRWRELGTRLLLELLGGMRAAVDGGGGGSGGAGNRVAAQRLFAQSQGFLQVCNVLNEEYSQVRGQFSFQELRSRYFWETSEVRLHG